MKVELYTARLKRLSGEQIDIYVYDHIPQKLRVQIGYIIEEIFDYEDQYEPPEAIYGSIGYTLMREWGMRELTHYEDNRQDLLEYFYSYATTDQCLDLIEYCFQYVYFTMLPDTTRFRGGSTYLTDTIIKDTIDELNERFRENGVGYQFTDGYLVRVDSQVIHAEVVLPVLKLLSDNQFYAGANDEFRSAHQHYRHGKYKETLVDCLKAFESLMKAIHIKHGWKFDPKRATAKDLINGCLVNNLVPVYLQNQFASFRDMLETGIPTLRNKEAGHGQGADVKEVPEHMAGYMLHLTATNLLFLAECEKALN